MHWHVDLGISMIRGLICLKTIVRIWWNKQRQGQGAIGSLLACISVSNTELVCYMLNVLNTCVYDVICFLKLLYEICYLKLFDVFMMWMMNMNLVCTWLINDSVYENIEYWMKAWNVAMYYLCSWWWILLNALWWI